MTEEARLRVATHRGRLPVGALEMQCAVLDDGTRVISGRSMTAAIGMKGRGSGAVRIPNHPTLRDFITPECRKMLENPIQYLPSPTSTRAVPGYEATLLLTLAESILQARDIGVLKTEQELRYAQYADQLVRAFAAVGIIALVDEATGYQVDRDRDELSRILKAYISPELLPWTKRFPDEFYRQLFRLRNWTYSPLTVARPKAVAKYTSMFVYEKLPPGVLDELRAKNPVVDEHGNRAHRHHQFLSESIGNRHLEMQLAQVTTLMRISPNWDSFVRNFRRAFPPAGDVQEELDFEA
jgi:hypothetical protein